MRDEREGLEGSEEAKKKKKKKKKKRKTAGGLCVTLVSLCLKIGRLRLLIYIPSHLHLLLFTTRHVRALLLPPFEFYIPNTLP